ncbi:hypothetical protein [Solihabitans fulvus]|uniref:hypothetical protein n=1 Tax=Solihabitans fulvus TaxID=1892852 RepID=UPI001CB7624A|nr:hypothetical protein [Solihabitans fulvus]
MLLPGHDTRVVELRVHGVQGTTAESLVDAVAAVDVAGDGVGRIVRPADRLLRPAPGPVLQADGRPVPRIVEGYIWGGMTSGGWAKATWALLFPFSLANVAHWMLPPAPERSAIAQALGLLLRALLRLAALLLTTLLISQLTVVGLDMIAAQCLAPNAPCLGSLVPNELRELSWFRPALGLLIPAVAVFVLHRVSTVDWKIDLTAPKEGRPGQTLSGMPGASVAADPDTAAMRALHTAASLAVIALLALGGPAAPSSTGVGVTVCWTIALALLGLTALGVMLLDDPTGGAPHRPGRWVRVGLGAWPRTVLVGASGLLLVGTAVVLGPLPVDLPVRLPGTDVTVQVVAALLGVVSIVFAVLLVPAALLARRTWSALPRELRPWAGGWMAAPMLAIAALLGGGFGAGIALTIRPLIDRSLTLPQGYDYLSLLWGVAGTLAAVSALCAGGATFVVRWVTERRGRAWPREVALLHADRPQDAARAASAWWWARWERRHSHHALLVMATVLCGGALVSAVLRLKGVPPAAWARPFSTVGVAALGLLAVSLLRLVYLAARRPETGRRVGILADLASFWPREAHPTVPPCYALKVVPEVAARAAEHLKDPGTRVVLTGHSQGTLLVAVAAARLLESLPEADRSRVGLITAGSQLQWAYPRAFPAVVPHSSLAELAGGLGGRWRALCRGTDPLGGAVTTWRRQVFDGMLLGVGFREDGTEGALEAATTGPTGALVLGADHWLPDPQRGPFAGRRWLPGVNGHADYSADPEWDRAVAIAAGLERADSPPPASGLVLPVARKAGTPAEEVKPPLGS